MYQINKEEVLARGNSTCGPCSFREEDKDDPSLGNTGNYGVASTNQCH